MDTITNKDIKVLDVTLRDGSYVIDFQFDQHDTAVICSLLEAVGIDWIEIGHGVGLGGSAKGYGEAASTDEEYIQAAAANIKHAKWGSFFIPGIGTFDDIKMAASYNMPFIRVGTNINDFAKAIPYIELAKSLGMFVAYNGMKSYAASPKEFAQVAVQAKKYGTDMICLVDSAGGLFPEDVEQYFKQTQDATDIKIGFHGHDNLSLVMANTLKAIEMGAFMVDTSIQGMGRSAGNAKTEVLFAILKQKGLFQNVDLNRLIDIGQNIINPLIKNKGADPLAIISGYAMFHSSFTPKVSKYAKDYNIDIRDLIIRLCEEDKVDAPDDLLTKLSKEQQQKNKPDNKTVSINLTHKDRDHNSPEGVKSICKELRSHGIKYNKNSVINVVFDESMKNNLAVSYNMQSNQDYICGAVTVKDEKTLIDILPVIDESVDILLLDSDVKEFTANQVLTAQENLKSTTALAYSDSDAWVEAVEEQTIRILNELAANKKIFVSGNSYKSTKLAMGLAGKNAEVYYYTAAVAENKIPTLHYISSENEAKQLLPQMEVIILWEDTDKVLLPEIADHTEKVFVLDAGLNSLSEKLLEAIIGKENIKTLRVNIWPTLMATLSSIHSLYKINKDSFGRANIQGVNIVSGGYIGAEGDIVVDNIKSPRKIIGMADGKGKVIYDYPESVKINVHTLENAINNILLSEQAH